MTWPTALEFVAATLESDAITYLPWEKCPTRAQERRGTKVDKRWLVDHDSTVKEKNVSTVPQAQLGTDLQLQDMFLRRALAVDQGGLMSFGSHEKLHSRLLKAHLETPPPGYARVGIKQLRRADEKAWDLLVELTRASIKGTSEQGQ